ncbi:hypothetical protein [Moorena sp. SIO3I8]|uniref:hypothetical protein n=1 Tax=Moorena sp. SIO3I8 TaxID=2607833 RepID=UPI0013BFC9A6|nr:hypothetical protein [Moorena sp. SIO3I8]NEO08432.1 hypothetical protein [Moorena sp. SIO3I8]
MSRSSRNHRKQRNVTPQYHTEESASAYASDYSATYNYKAKTKSPIKFLGAIQKVLDVTFSFAATAAAAVGVTLHKLVMSPESKVLFGTAQWVYFTLISIDNFYIILSKESGLIPTPGGSSWIGWMGYNPLNFKVNLWMLFIAFLAMGICNLNQGLFLGLWLNPRSKDSNGLQRFMVMALGAFCFLVEFSLTFMERPTFQPGMGLGDSLLLTGYNIISVIAIAAGARLFLLSLGEAEAVGQAPRR